MTERGSFHGHFLLWLLGGLNLSDLHAKLTDNPEYQKQFFDYFESIIQHHLPDLEVNIPENHEPRVERPPVPPFPLEHPTLDLLNEWESAYITKVKKCGEILQRHVCHPVCHKYGNEGKCWFLFPHEIVEASYFDADKNAVVLLCRDGTVNYFNPYILIFCRHNHDIKCILSGKSAKAAMFYITDYITKMDCKTHEMLSLLSRAVSHMPDTSNSSPTNAAKILLHKCLSQFTRQQQIHAQQAARYLRGFGDEIKSHETVPMLSSCLLSFVKSTLTSNITDNSIENRDHDDEEVEQQFTKILTDNTGNLIDTNQVHHYWHCNDTLLDMSFYDFCRFVKIERKSQRSNVKNTSQTRLGVLERHALKSTHPLHETHHLIEYTNKIRGKGHHQLVPRVVGMSIPRETSTEWPFFVLSHFKPFGIENPLIPSGETPNTIFNTYDFFFNAMTVMKNWNAIYECEDERDAERLQKHASETQKSSTVTNSMAFLGENIECAISKKSHSEQDFKMQQMILTMQQSN